MSYSKERDEFIAIVTQEGLSVETARKLLRYATTLHRLAEAQCNGDWPADNGERKVVFCAECESGFVRSVMMDPRSKKQMTADFLAYHEARHKADTAYETGVGDSTPPEEPNHLICPDCRTYQLVRKSLPEGYKAIVNGDPRGAVLKITVPSGRTNDWGREGIYVPARHR